jgi:hypothetical protein
MTLFQTKSRERVHSNCIKYLKRGDGSLELKQKDIEEVAVGFYQELFSTQDDMEPEGVLDYVLEKVSALMNEALVRPYIVE